jgi:hypothetical protein
MLDDSIEDEMIKWSIDIKMQDIGGLEQLCRTSW